MVVFNNGPPNRVYLLRSITRRAGRQVKKLSRRQRSQFWERIKDPISAEEYHPFLNKSRGVFLHTGFGDEGYRICFTPDGTIVNVSSHLAMNEFVDKLPGKFSLGYRYPLGDFLTMSSPTIASPQVAPAQVAVKGPQATPLALSAGPSATAAAVPEPTMAPVEPSTSTPTPVAAPSLAEGPQEAERNAEETPSSNPRADLPTQGPIRTVTVFSSAFQPAVQMILEGFQQTLLDPLWVEFDDRQGALKAQVEATVEEIGQLGVAFRASDQLAREGLERTNRHIAELGQGVNEVAAHQAADREVTAVHTTVIAQLREQNELRDAEQKQFQSETRTILLDHTRSLEVLEHRTTDLPGQARDLKMLLREQSALKQSLGELQASQKQWDAAGRDLCGLRATVDTLVTAGTHLSARVDQNEERLKEATAQAALERARDRAQVELLAVALEEARDRLDRQERRTDDEAAKAARNLGRALERIAVAASRHDESEDALRDLIEAVKTLVRDFESIKVRLALVENQGVLARLRRFFLKP
jgi:hypothetical protein